MPVGTDDDHRETRNERKNERMKKKSMLGSMLVMAGVAVGLYAADVDMKKPVKVFILMGQSNMVGMGNVTGDKGETLEKAVKTEKLYPYLLDASGNWAERNDVRFVQVMEGKKGGMNVLHN